MLIVMQYNCVKSVYKCVCCNWTGVYNYIHKQKCFESLQSVACAYGDSPLYINVLFCTVVYDACMRLPIMDLIHTKLPFPGFEQRRRLPPNRSQ